MEHHTSKKPVLQIHEFLVRYRTDPDPGIHISI